MMARTEFVIALACTLVVPAAGRVSDRVQNQAATPIAEGFGAGAYRPGDGVIKPTLLVQKEPQYTPEGVRARIEGSVDIEMVVRTDGSVGDARVTKSLDTTFGLDANALEAVRLWKYLPALLNGKPVPCVIAVTVPFKLTRPAALVTGEPPSQESEEDFRKGAYLDSTPNLVRPEAVTEISPAYTMEAMRQRIKGSVELEAIVMPDGSVGKVRIIKSLDALYGLDQAAVNAARKWKFRAGRLNGQPVPVVVQLTLAFVLKGNEGGSR